MNTLQLIFIDGRSASIQLDDFTTQDLLYCFMAFRSGTSDHSLFEGVSTESGLVSLVLDMQTIVGMHITDDNRDPRKLREIDEQLKQEKKEEMQDDRAGN